MSGLSRLCPERADWFQLKAKVSSLHTWTGLAVHLAAAAQPTSACRIVDSGKACNWGTW